MIHLLLNFSLFLLQLRENIFNFAQKELAPYAAEIDKKNEFTDLRVSLLILKFKWSSFYLMYNFNL